MLLLCSWGLVLGSSSSLTLIRYYWGEGFHSNLLTNFWSFPLLIIYFFLITWVKVSLSSLNRHAVATRADVGIPKAVCLKKHFSAIFPECHVEAKVLLYDSSSEEEILSGNPDFVLDCIDNIDTKVWLSWTDTIESFEAHYWFMHNV